MNSSPMSILLYDIGFCQNHILNNNNEKEFFRPNMFRRHLLNFVCDTNRKKENRNDVDEQDCNSHIIWIMYQAIQKGFGNC